MNPAETFLVTHALVADSGLARLMRVTGPHRHRVIEQLETFERASAHLAAHELITDRAGRVFESSGRAGSNATHTRHGVAGDYDPHVVEIEHFVKSIVQRLQNLYRAGELKAWVLVAEPRLLGVLRAHLPAELHKLLLREISGDYVHADRDRVLELVDSGR